MDDETPASRPARLRLAAAPAPAPAGAPASAAELLDAETRLLACAVGEHLPLELALQVAELRARRAALG